MYIKAIHTYIKAIHTCTLRRYTRVYLITLKFRIFAAATIIALMAATTPRRSGLVDMSI